MKEIEIKRLNLAKHIFKLWQTGELVCSTHEKQNLHYTKDTFVDEITETFQLDRETKYLIDRRMTQLLDDAETQSFIEGFLICTNMFNIREKDW